MDTSENLGTFTNTSTWCFHTFQAHALLKGKVIEEDVGVGGKRYELPGLNSIGRRFNLIWDCAKNDDPYAEMTLIEIERLIKRATAALDKHQRKVKKAFNALEIPDGLDIVLNTSINTLTLTLDDIVFRTTYAKQLLIIIARYDVLVREIVTYREFGLIPARQAKAFLYHITKAIRAIFMETLRFKKTGVTRLDFQKETSTAKIAEAKMGVLPLAVIKGEITAEWGPNNVQPSLRH